MFKPPTFIIGDKAGKFDQVENALEAMFGLEYKGTHPLYTNTKKGMYVGDYNLSIFFSVIGDHSSTITNEV